MKEMDKDGFYTKINVNPVKTQLNLGNKIRVNKVVYKIIKIYPTTSEDGKFTQEIGLERILEDKSKESETFHNKKESKDKKEPWKFKRSRFTNKDFVLENRKFQNVLIIIGASLLGTYYISYLFLFGLILLFLQFFSLSLIIQLSIIVFLIIFGIVGFFGGILTFNLILMFFGGLILLNGIIDIYEYKKVRDKEMGLK